MDTNTAAVQLAQAVTQSGIAEQQVATLREARRTFERKYILAVLERYHWHVAATARALGLQRPNLYRKARQLGIALKRTQDVGVA